MTPEPMHQKEGERRPRVQVLAILLGVIPVYLTPVLSIFRKDEPVTLQAAFIYSITVGSFMILVILLLLKYLCGERIRDLNLKPGTWWKDILAGIALMVVTLGFMMLLQDPLGSLFPPEPFLGLEDFIQFLRQPWMAVLILGPGLAIAAGISEELTRVFLLTRLWKINASRIWNWFAIFLSAFLFGMGHIYRGPANAILAGFSGLILAIYYYRFGRVLPMMIAHYLHDVLQFAALLLLSNAS